MPPERIRSYCKRKLPLSVVSCNLQKIEEKLYSVPTANGEDIAMRMMTFIVIALASFIYSGSASAADYYKKKWFDYPDPFVAPRFETRTGCAHWIKPWRGSKICTNPTHFQVKVALLRRDVTFIVSGPDAPNEVIRRAIVGYATGCAATAITAAEAAASATPSPEPSIRIGAASAVLYNSFYVCVSGISVAGIAGSIVGQLHINLDTSGTHWSPL